jgi:hypothetical protein
VISEDDKLLEFIEQHGLSYKENSRSYVFECPRCHGKEKLYMEKRGGRFICFVCAEIDGYRGRPEFALSDLASVPIGEVKTFLYGAGHRGTVGEIHFNLGEFFGEDDLIEDNSLVIPEVQFPFDFYPIDHSFSERGVEYLETRGIPLDIARQYNLHYAPVLRRVIFPVELGDRLVGWQERTILPTKIWDDEAEKFREVPKMLSSKDIPTAQVVMFSNRLQHSEHVVVCEGPIDAIKMHKAGGNVATMGKAIGKGQVETLRDPGRLTRAHLGSFQYAGIRRVYLALDPDANRETMRLVREFSDLEVYLIKPPPGAKDIGELSFDEAYECFKNAERVGAGFLYLHFR